MISNFKRVSPRLLEAIVSSPDLVIAVLEMDRQIIDTLFGPLPVTTRLKKQLDRMSEDEREMLYKRNAGRINEFLKKPVSVREPERCPANIAKTSLDEAGLTQDDPVTELSLDRAYHLHRLLCDEPWRTSSALCCAIEGGTKIGECLECGPARFLTPDQVSNVAAALSQVSENALRTKLDSGQIDYELVNPGDLASSLRGFVALRDYYEEAASKGNAMLLYETWYPPPLQS